LGQRGYRPCWKGERKAATMLKKTQQQCNAKKNTAKKIKLKKRTGAVCYVSSKHGSKEKF